MSLARGMCWVSLLGAAVCLAAGSLAVPSTVTAQVARELDRADAELTKSAETDPGHADPSSDPLSVDPDLAVWTFVVFAVLLAVLWKFAWGPIVAGLEKREHSIASNIADAQRSHEEAKALLAQYEAKLAAAEQRVRELIETGKREAERVKQDILAEAKSAAEAERLRALRDIESATDQALQSLAERSANLAVELAGKIVRAKLSAGDHARLIEEAVAKFPAGAASSN